MADISSMLIGGVQKQISEQPDYASDVNKGAELASHIEGIQAQRQQLENAKEQLKMQKFDKMGNWFETAAKMPDGAAKKAFVNDFIPKGVSALGLGDAIDPTSLKMMSGNPELAAYLRSKVMDQSLKFPDVLAALKDPESLAKLVPEAQRFGDQQDLQNTVQSNLGQLESDYKTSVLEQGKLNRASTMAGLKIGTNKEQFADNQLKDFIKQVANPGGRSGLGQTKKLIDTADAATTLAGSLGMGKGQIAPSDESDSDRVSRYDQATSRQISEFVRSMDRMLSQGNPTIAGQEHLTPTTYEGLMKKYGEKVLNVPEGLSQGQFVDQMMDTVNRERNLNASKFRQQAGALKSGYNAAISQYGDKMDAAIESALKNPMAGKPKSTATFKIGGQNMTSDQAKQFYQENPGFQPDPDTKKALGL